MEKTPAIRSHLREAFGGLAKLTVVILLMALAPGAALGTSFAVAVALGPFSKVVGVVSGIGTFLTVFTSLWSLIGGLMQIFFPIEWAFSEEKAEENRRTRLNAEIFRRIQANLIGEREKLGRALRIVPLDAIVVGDDGDSDLDETDGSDPSERN